jgi:hypothetical protein
VAEPCILFLSSIHFCVTYAHSTSIHLHRSICITI